MTGTKYEGKARQGSKLNFKQIVCFAPRSIPQAQAGRGNAVALQLVLLVLLRGWSK